MWPFIKQWEGTTYENDPDDPGGATQFGIDQRSHPKEDIRNLTEERAKAIYWESYWQANRCGEYGPCMGEVVFNCAVNCGPGRVHQFIEGGARTASAYLDAQAAFYKRLAARRPKSKKYLKGWMNRLTSLRKLLKL